MFTKFQVLLLAVELLGDGSSLRESYSGRGMYGKTAPAIVSQDDITTVNREIRHAVRQLWSDYSEEEKQEHDLFEIMDEFELHRSNSMGGAYVYY